MSVSGITTSLQLSSLQTNFQQLRSEFSQLGQDLSAGNLTQAQTDFVSLSQAASSQFGSNSPISKTLSTIGQALQSGNLSAAQQAFSTLPVGLVGPSTVSDHTHPHQGHTGFSQVLNQLGQALQSGNLSAAQQAFTTLEQNFQAMGSAGITPATTSPTSSSGLSVTV
jgi:soluble cytochrome b562